MSAATEGERQRGQMLALFAICLVAIIAMTGLVIDGEVKSAGRVPSAGDIAEWLIAG